ncbi:MULTISPECIES: YraN family protein [Microbacterium]|jgi:putative endonuclease|uniref:YraN family protein n=1 Tax=Microbacterium TaxID=33882 RepID=UPI000C494422|nr:MULTISPECIES: YraN family protein [Microbacterium]MAB19747.1 YraN family protein [Microbacterium sp.]MAY48364.1 YraN family protein [Microbacterium sp.]HAS31470.1 YraN family protein [Microbacterium sp.]HBR88159.1 YraN family protein [Microbacterium sp.]HBS75467.1 YraN family protein [Microbacterium sp.]|tara:strand:- start:115 stop:477 length:363 start_codon:yes stop_codon:yes gene_type:complete
MAIKDDLGRAGEQAAHDHLVALGFVVLDRNWRCGQGEIDIVAREAGELVIVEVKTRRSTGFGHPFDAIDERKRSRLWRLGRAWAAAHPEPSRGLALRTDVIGVTGSPPGRARIEHLRDLR